MAREGVRDALKSFAEAKDQFSLKEFRDHYYPGDDLSNLLIAALPALSGLSLGWRGTENEYRIFRIPRTNPLHLTNSESGALEDHIRNGEDLAHLEDLTQKYIERKTGKRWDDGKILERIQSAVMQQKGQYWREGASRKIGYRKGYSVIAYLAYHAPVYFTQFQHAFLMLIGDGLIPKHARVLDVGSGPGIVSLAISSIVRKIPEFSVELFSLERSEEFREAYRTLLAGFSDMESRIRLYPVIEGDLRESGTLLLPSAMDLIVLQNVTNELIGASPEERAHYLRNLSRLLVPGGCMIVIEPAELSNSIELRKTAWAATDNNLTLFSPCCCTWGGRCTPGRCWSFIKKPSIRPTRLMTALAGDHQGFRFLNTDIKYSYAVLVKSPKRHQSYTGERSSSFSRLSSLKGRIGRKVNVAVALMSGDIGEKGMHVFLACDGTSGQPVYLILPSFHVSQANHKLISLPYSTMIEISGALVRFNKNHDAWNLLLTRESQVDPVYPSKQRIEKE